MVKKYILIGCGSVLIICLLLFGGCMIWLFTLPEGGVKLQNDMEPYAVKYLEKHKVLPEGSKLVAYYDETMNCDGSEAVILTKKQIIYHKNGKNNSVDLKDVKDIKYRKEALIGDVIEVYGKDGDIIKIEIAPLNQADTFINALKNAWEASKTTK
jgi:PH (Pleckstrin Homology) domain-containing protein